MRHEIRNDVVHPLARTDLGGSDTSRQRFGDSEHRPEANRDAPVRHLACANAWHYVAARPRCHSTMCRVRVTPDLRSLLEMPSFELDALLACLIFDALGEWANASSISARLGTTSTELLESEEASGETV
jgi:hypothetical protein